MPSPITFYFDFSSPYAYFASHKIDGIAADFGRDVVWKPFMVGAIFKESGNQPLIHQPLKGDYCRQDWVRLGQYQGVPWVLPEPFPIATLAAARAYYWLEQTAPDKARPFARACFLRYFGDGADITTPGAVAEVGAGLGIDAEALKAACADPAIKQRLRSETEAALGAGVCGSPFFFIDGEPFWGSDRLWMMRRYLKNGSW